MHVAVFTSARYSGPILPTLLAGGRVAASGSGDSVTEGSYYSGTRHPHKARGCRASASSNTRAAKQVTVGWRSWD